MSEDFQIKQSSNRTSEQGEVQLEVQEKPHVEKKSLLGQLEMLGYQASVTEVALPS